MTADELEMIAGLCREHDVIVVSDEVYEWLVYPPQQHIRIGQYMLLIARRIPCCIFTCAHVDIEAMVVCLRLSVCLFAQ